MKRLIDSVFGLRSGLRAFAANEHGGSIIVIGLTLPAMVGALGLAAEVGYWRQHHRDMQNAADAAAIAAATNGTASYATEGKAVAAQYGLKDGTGQITVTVTNPVTAPGCANAKNCYQVTISDNVPLLLSQVVGFKGDAKANGQAAATISAVSVATFTNAYAYCVLALGGSGKQGITSNGAPNTNLNGCNTMSNTSSTCNGHNLNANVGDAVGTNNGCGNTQRSNVAAATDTFAQDASNIPNNTCTGKYPQEPGKNGPPLPKSNLWNGNYGSLGVKVVCGDQQLTGNVSLNDTVLVIENGMLDTNGFTFQGSNLTVVFSGTNNGNYQHIPTGGGTLDIAAPTTGDWSGVAMYQDPALTNGVDMSAAGNTPTWNISGLVYMPHASVTLSGAVSKSGTGQSCFEFVMDNITINGTGAIFQGDTQCGLAGLNQTKGGNRGMLVN